uniref:Reverse transcriptase domain-containing protein n=1 Tax=Hucho hucho TaxID=62062 RepID=A0A4W5LLC8_9TELE
MKEQMYESDVCAWWEEMKCKLKAVVIAFAKRVGRERKSEQRELQRRLGIEQERAEGIPGYNITEYLRVREELREVERRKCEGAKAQYVIEGERSTAYFLGLEKRMQEKGKIVELVNENGEKVTDLVGIMETVQAFYTDLYTSVGVNEECMDQVLGAVEEREITEEGMKWDSGLTVEEIKEAIRGLNLNKSPGSDGLTVELYRAFVDLLAPILGRVYESMERRKIVPDSMGLGVLTLLYKGKGEKNSLKNYRALTLLNCDYKILTKALANRMNKVMASIIEPTQAYGVPGRDVIDTLCTIRDVVKDMREGGGVMLCLDLNKAFDRVEHVFLLKTMERLGVGERMRSWV